MIAPRQNLCKRYFSRCKNQKLTDWFSKTDERADGAEGSRTPDLNNANVAFYQLNYGPAQEGYVTVFELFVHHLCPLSQKILTPNKI